MKKISIILLVILFLGCKTVKTVEQSQEKHTDSISYVEIIKIDTIKIPGEKIQIELPCDQLRPQSFVQGRANVRAEPKGSVYIVTASCDSIEKIVISKDREINRLSKALKISNREKTKELTFMQTFYIGAGMLFLLLIILFVVGKLLTRWKLQR
jgi:hypothetical protein